MDATDTDNEGKGRTMSSIETIGYPLVFRVRREPDAASVARDGPGRIEITVKVRALEGMQKEAIVCDAGGIWRMVSDEGPYLNGTDLAPFPLAFFSSGMAFCTMTAIENLARENGIAIRSLELTQDNYYTMEGSAIQGTMTGGARPVEMNVAIDADAPKDKIAQLVYTALASSPADACMREILKNTFSVTKNGAMLVPEQLSPSSVRTPDDPALEFEDLEPAPDDAFAADIIRKLSAAETLFGVEGGAGSSLQAEQKRTLHVRAIARRRDDGLKQARIQLFKPIGSVFEFLCDDSRATDKPARAPSGLAYLSAGIAYCFMTQLGRYAQIVKRRLQYYGVIQDTIFRIPSTGPTASLPVLVEPVDTHVYVASAEPDEAIQTLVAMGEQTCFLHAALRSANKTRVRIAPVTSEGRRRDAAARSPE